MLLLNVVAFPQQLKLGKNPYVVNKSAVLELESSNQGLLFPRIDDTSQINALSPPDGMVVFHIPTLQLLLHTNGYWKPLTVSSALSSYWSTAGNAGTTASNFLGTTDLRHLYFKTNGIQGMILDSAGNVGIGTSPLFTSGLNREKLLVDAGGNITTPATSYNVISGKGYINNYLQLNIQNRSPGTNASSDVVATADNGDESTNYVDLGINSSGFTNSTYPVLGGINNAYLYSAGNDFIIGNITASKSLRFFTGGYATTNERMRIDGSGNVGIGLLSPSAYLNIKAGTATAGTAPLKFTSGTLLTTAEAGAMEFLTDKFYGTITTSAARKEFTLNEGTLLTGQVPFASSTGRLTNLPTFTYTTNRLSPTYLTLAAGTATAGTAPLVMTAGVNLTNPVAGSIEFDGVHFYGTIGTTRYNFDQQAGTVYTGSNGIALVGNDFRNTLITGTAGSQTVVGGTAAGNSLILSSTSNATKGKILFGTSGYSEANNKLGLGNNIPTEVLDVTGNVKFSGALMPNNLAGTAGYFLASSGASTAPVWTAFDTTSITSFAVKVRSLFSSTAPITYSNGTIGITQASGSTNGYLSSADWNTFNSKAASYTSGNLTEATSNILTITGGTGAVLGSGTSVQVKQASGSQSGFLSSTDWTTFNGKLSTIDTTNITSFYLKTRSLFSAGTGIGYNNGTGVISNSGVLSVNGNAGALTMDTTYISSFSSKVRSLFGGTAPITYTNGQIGITQASGSTNGYLSSTDWNTFNSKLGSVTSGNLTEATSNILTITGGTGAVLGSGTSVQVKQASGSQSGFLSSTDWTTFNGKLSTIDTTNITSFYLKSRSLFSAGTGIGYNNGTGVISNSGVLSVNGNAGALTMDTTYISNFSPKVRSLFGGTAPITYTNGQFGITQASGSTNGYLSSTDWNTFNSKAASYTSGNLTEATSNILTITGGTGAVLGSGTSVQVKQASGSQSGFLSSTDWTTFNGKLSTIDTTNITNFYLKSRSLFSAGTGIGYNNGTGVISNSGVLSLNGNAGALTMDTTYISSFSSKVRSLFGGTAPITYTNGQFGITQASGSTNGYLSSTDWNTFNSKAASYTSGNLTEATSNILTITGGTGAVLGSGTSVQVKQASGSQSGFLSSTDWTTFNGKLSTIDTTNITNFYLKSRSLFSAGTGIGYNNGTGVISNSGVLSVNGNAGALTMDTTYISNFSPKVRSLFGGTAPITYTNGQIGITQASGSTNGYLSSSDWNTFNSKLGSVTSGNLTEATSNILTITGGTGAVLGSGTSVQVKQASGSQSGFLSSTDWTTFNNKLSTIDTTNISSFATKVRSLFSASAPITYTNGLIGITQATTSTNGYLSSTDWNTFNNKASTANVWSLTGNSGTASGTNFIGTTGSQSLVMRTNSAQGLLLDSLGNVGIGSSPTFTASPNREKFLVDAGTNAANDFINVVSGKGSTNNYLQVNIQNRSSGTAASSDIVATNNLGTESTNYIDMGINSSGFATGAITGAPNTAYLFATGNDFVIGNQTSGKPLRFYTTASTTSADAMIIDSAGRVGIGNIIPTQKLDVTGNIRLSGALMPNNNAGTAGYYLTSAGAGAPPTWSAFDTASISGFSAKVRSLFSGTAPITYSNGIIGITQANASTNGYLSSTDWTTFNNKLSTIDTTNITNFYLKSRSLFSAGTGIGYNNGTGVISNSGVLSVNGNAGALTMDTTYISSFSSKVRSLFSGTAPITYTNGQIGITQASGSTNGYLSSTDWNTFNSKAASYTSGNLTEATSNILTITGGTGAVLGSGTSVQVKQASGSQSGFLSSTDWTTFNGKLSTIDTTNITNFYLKSRSLFSAGTGIGYNNGTGVISNSGVLSVNGNAGALTMDTTYISNFSPKVRSLFGGTAPITYTNGQIGITQASGSTNGYLSSADWNTFNSKLGSVTSGNLTEATSNILTITGGTGAVLGSGTSVQVKQASGSQSGFLSSTDWTTFNNKVSSISLGSTVVDAATTFSVTSGAATGSRTLNTQVKNTIFSGPTSGVDATPTFRTLVPADLPIATTSLLGAVSVGSGLAITPGGILSATNTNAGTVTTVSASGTQGVTTSVTNATTTPAIAIGLGAITPTSVAATGTVAGSNLSGTNTGDQTITLTSDVTGTGTGSFATTIGANKVTYAKMQQVSASKLLGNFTASLANAAEISLGTGLSFVGSTLTYTPATSGTVTSVGLSLPSIFTVTNSPVTSSGTLTGAFNTQSANLVFAGPASGAAAAPTFRSLAAADLPVATASTVGGISAGNGLSVSGAGVLTTNFNLTSLSATAPLAYNNTTGVFSMPKATTSVDGYLSATDWNTFNNKASASNVWSLTGNSGTVPATNFLGTTDLTGFSMRTNNLQGFLLDSVGNVGIGLSPAFTSGNREKLLVDAGTTSSYNVISGKGSINNYLQLNIQNKSAGTAASTDVVATADNGDETTNYVDMGINSSGNTASYFGSANDAYLYNLGQNFLIGTGTANKNLMFLTGGGTQASNERMRIDGSGNVGIGVTNAANPLVVKDVMEIRRVGTVSELLFSNTASSGDFRIAGDGGDIFWQGGGSRTLQMGSYWGMLLAGDRQTGTLPAFQSGFTNTNVLIAAQRDASVPVAIQGFSATQTANLTEWRNYSGTAINAVDKNGNFGIGTVAPAYKLHVSGTNPLALYGVQAGTSTSADSLLTITSGLVRKIPISTFLTGGITSLNGLTAAAQTFATPGTSGTAPSWSSTTATHTLNIPLASTASVTAGLLSNTDWTTFNNKASTANVWSLTGNAGTASGTNYIGTTNNQSFVMRTNGIQGFILDSLGNVGIGTSPTFTASPNREQLLVDAETNAANDFINVISGKGNTNNYLQVNIQNRSAGTAASSDVVATNDIGNESTNFIDMGINSSGFASGTITGAPNTAYLYATGNDFVIGNSTSGKPLRFYTTASALNTEAMRIDSAGKIGLGTTNPLNKLSVVGTNPVYLAGLQNGNAADSLLTITGGVVRKINVSTLTSLAVTSVGLSLPSIFTVTGSPVTTSGTLTGSLNTQAANLIFAGPASGGAAAPTFRALTATDLPAGTGTTTNTWTTSGNAGTVSGTNFLGTTGPQSLVMRTNSLQGLLLDSLGNVGIGTAPIFTASPNREKLLVDAGTSAANNFINVISGKATTNNYMQVNIQNRSNGTAASSDIVATNDLGTESVNFVDMGINSSGNTSTGVLGGANNAYLYGTGTDFAVGNSGTGALKLFTGTTEDMRIDASGNVGIGTTSPTQKLDVTGAIRATTSLWVDGGNTNSGSGSPGVFFGDNTTGESIASKRTTGGNQYGLDFYTSSSNRLSILQNGNVGIGTTAPTDKLTLAGNMTPSANLTYDIGSSTLRWSHVYSANFVTTSDRRLKTNILKSQYGLKEILLLQPITFNWKKSSDTDLQLGLIAQDVKKIIPEAVSGDEAKEDLGINYMKLVPVLINAIKDQQKQIEDLKQQIIKLQK